MNKISIIVYISTLLLASCGGGGGSNTGSTDSVTCVLDTSIIGDCTLD
jgi:hypothetical protein